MFPPYLSDGVEDFPNTFTLEKDPVEQIPAEEYSNFCYACTNILRTLSKTNRFTNEGSIEERTRRYEGRSNPLNQFLADACEQDQDEQIEIKEFAERFAEWLKEHNMRRFTSQALTKVLTNEGYAKGKATIAGRSAIWIYGLKWKSNTIRTEEVKDKNDKKDSILFHLLYKGQE